MSSTRNEPVSTISWNAARKQVIADQNAGLVVPQQVGRGPSAALGAFVDHVIMQQRGGVNELDRGGQMHIV